MYIKTSVRTPWAFTKSFNRYSRCSRGHCWILSTVHKTLVRVGTSWPLNKFPEREIQESLYQLRQLLQDLLNILRNWEPGRESKSATGSRVALLINVHKGTVNLNSIALISAILTDWCLIAPISDVSDKLVLHCTTQCNDLLREKESKSDNHCSPMFSSKDTVNIMNCSIVLLSVIMP